MSAAAVLAVATGDWQKLAYWDSLSFFLTEDLRLGYSRLATSKATS